MESAHFQRIKSGFHCIGFFIGTFVVIAFVFAGGYMVTADTDVKMAGLLGFAVLSVFLFLSGIGFCILNLLYILRQSDPQENKYGNPIPYNPPKRV